MNLQAYTAAAARTCPQLGCPRTSEPTRASPIDNAHMVLGMVTEVAEIADVFKKDMAYGKPIDWVNVGEEIGDLMFYVVNFCRINGIVLEHELQKNVNKLLVRYPVEFTGEQAIHRNVAAERIELEK